MTSLTRIRAQLSRILHLNEPPRRTALAFALGVFIAFSPTYGLHTLSAVFCAWAFRLNAVALLAGAFINNPWTVVPILAATFWTGLWLMGVPESAPVPWSELSLDALYVQMKIYAVPFFAGGIVLGLLGALLSYPIVYWIIVQARARRRQSSDDPPPVATRNPPEL